MGVEASLGAMFAQRNKACSEHGRFGSTNTFTIPPTTGLRLSPKAAEALIDRQAPCGHALAKTPPTVGVWLSILSRVSGGSAVDIVTSFPAPLHSEDLQTTKLSLVSIGLPKLIS